MDDEKEVNWRFKRVNKMLPIKAGEGGVKFVMMMNGNGFCFRIKVDLENELSIAISEERYEDAQKLKEEIDNIPEGVSTDFII